MERMSPGLSFCATAIVWQDRHTVHFRKGILRMARKVHVHLLDDIDGSQAEETLKFGLDGTLYEIDLNAKHANKLRSSLAAYVSHARRIGRGHVVAPGRGRGQAPARTDREQNQAIRDWAKTKGIQVSDRGRIPATIIEQYHLEAGR
jgi:hypothetical protein